MKVATTYNNFARAKIDHDMMGRFDLPIYRSGTDVFENFISNFKGNAIYRPGFESVMPFQDCEMIEFKFSNSQNYLMLFYAGKIRFMSYDSNGNFGYVLSGGVPLEVTTPYTLAECKQLDYSQNADVMVITHPNYPPKDLKRTSANSFTFSDHQFTDAGGSPFANISPAITAITKANPAVITSSSLLRDGDTISISGVVGMTQVNGITVQIKKLTATTFALIGIDSTGYTTYSSGGIANRAASYPAHCLFYKARLYFSRLTTIWGSATGNYNSYDIPTTVVDTSPVQFTLADVTAQIDWLFGGDNSLVAGSADGIVAINGGGVGIAITADKVQANITSADGANASRPLRKDGLIFYLGRNSRNMYYFSYDLLSESFIAEDANFISYDITKNGLGKIRYKKDRNDIVYAVRGDGRLVSLNFKQKESIIGWHTQNTNGQVKNIAVITNNIGDPQLFTLTLRGGIYYIEHQSSFVEFSERSSFFLNSATQAVDTEAHNRYVAEQLRSCNYLDNSLSLSGLQSGNSITYNPGTNIVTATTPIFSAGSVGKEIVYQTQTGYESGRFKITAYNSTTSVTVEVLQAPVTTITGVAVALNTVSNWYLTFNVISGLTQYIGQTVGVITDGGYLTDFVIASDTLTLDNQISSITIGYKYRGLIKSFCLGFSAGPENTQTTMKAISRVGMRTVSSAGGKFGSSPYRLERLQDLQQGSLNYLPPPPIDGTKFITYVDDANIDKYFFVVQDEPLPLTVTSVMIEANYAMSS